MSPGRRRRTAWNSLRGLGDLLAAQALGDQPARQDRALVGVDVDHRTPAAAFHHAVHGLARRAILLEDVGDGGDELLRQLRVVAPELAGEAPEVPGAVLALGRDRVG